MDLNMTLYGKYKLKDLTVTKTGLPNLPNEAELKNLKWLARRLSELENQIGHFGIISAFRSYQVQNQVLGHDPYTQVNRKKSFHEAGMAADIYPIGQTIDAFFGKMLADEDILNSWGEVSIKPSQNAIHIGLPTDRLKGKAMILENGRYRDLSASEIEFYASPYRRIFTPVDQTPSFVSPVSPDLDSSAFSFDWSHINSQGLLLDKEYNLMNMFDFDFSPTQKAVGIGGIVALIFGGYFILKKS